MNSRIRLIACTLVLIFLAFAPVSDGLRVSGAICTAEVVPGQHFTHNMTVDIGGSDPPQKIMAEVLGFGQTVTGSYMDLEADSDTSPYTARNFLKVTPASAQLEPGVSQVFMLEGEIPEDVGAGGRYAFVNIHGIPSHEEGAGSISMVAAIGVPVLLTISGTELVKTCEITALSILGTQNIGVSVIFKNTGNYHYKALAEAVLKDEDGTIHANASTPHTGTSILPTCSRLFKLSLSPDSELQSGTYYVNATVSLEDGTILASKETAFDV